MTVRATVAVAETEHSFPMVFDNEPQPGDVVTLTVEGLPGTYVVVDVDPTGFAGNPPYLYGVYVKPQA